MAGEKAANMGGNDMKMPTIRGLIDRRVLVNFRVIPDALR